MYLIKKDEDEMTDKVTVTSRGMVTIPSKIRKKLNIKDGTKLVVREYKSGILYIPVIDWEDLFGTHPKDEAVIKRIYDERREEALRDSDRW
jgi:AbrB family looped-hinge helix DNA binding protein